MEVTITIPVIKCMENNKGHMHMMIQAGEISSEFGNIIGNAGFDVACKFVMEVNGEKYHVNPDDLYSALSKQLFKIGETQINTTIQGEQ